MYFKMYSFKSCVYYTSKASVELQSVHMPAWEVGKLSSPSHRDLGSQQLPCSLSLPRHQSPLVCTVQRLLQPQTMRQKARGIPRPGTRGAQLPGGLARSGPTSPLNFGLWKQGSLQESSPIPPAPHSTEVCFCGKGTNRDSLGIVLNSFSHDLEFSLFSRSSSSPSFNIKSFFCNSI